MNETVCLQPDFKQALGHCCQAAAKILPHLGVASTLLSGATHPSPPDELASSSLWGGPRNNFSCRSLVHANPVVLLHGLSGSRDFHLNKLAWDLNGMGYCTFSKTYGAHTLGDFTRQPSSVPVALLC